MSLTDLDFIPSDLHMSTGDRLRLVADLIEFAPSLWDQGAYIRDYGLNHDYLPARSMLGSGGECQTPGCVAGWGARLSPPDLQFSVPEPLASREGEYIHWQAAGAAALGLADDLSWVVFRAYPFTEDASAFANELRKLAELPEPRTLAAARSAGLRFEEEPTEVLVDD